MSFDTYARATLSSCYVVQVRDVLDNLDNERLRYSRMAGRHLSRVHVEEREAGCSIQKALCLFDPSSQFLSEASSTINCFFDEITFFFSAVSLF